MKPSSAPVFLFTALPCEAKPLTAQLRLNKLTEHHAFSVFNRGTCYLTVTGPGKIAMAAGIAYTMALFNASRYPVMINIGIAGNKTALLGDAFIAEKISDADSGKNFYPPLLYTAPCPTRTVITVSRPCVNYQPDYVYDMEAAAFYETASRFSSGELIQCFKIISDNADSPAENIQAKRVTEWIHAQVDTLEELVETLAEQVRDIEATEPEAYRQFLNKWHFSNSQQQQLKKLLTHWEILSGGKSLPVSTVSLASSREVLQWLEKQLEQLDFYL